MVIITIKTKTFDNNDVSIKKIDITKFNPGARICDLTVTLSILYGHPTLCSPELSFVSNSFSPLNTSVPDSKIV